jgi:hypothetical protein
MMYLPKSGLNVSGLNVEVACNWFTFPRVSTKPPSKKI